MASFTININDKVNEYLKKWGEEEGRKKSTMATYIIEQVVTAKYPEVFPPIVGTLVKVSQEEEK